MAATRTVLDMSEVNEAALARLLRDARPGDEIILEQNNIAVARVVPVAPNGAAESGGTGSGDVENPEDAPKRRVPIFGTGGLIIMRDDFDDPLEEFAEYM